MEYETIYVMI